MIPVVVGYQGYRSYGDVPYSAMKPGMTTFQRDYYSKASKEKVSADNYLANYQRFETIYGQNVSKTVEPEDYKKKASLYQLTDYELAHAPELKTHMKANRTQRVGTGNDNSLLRSNGAMAMSSSTSRGFSADPNAGPLYKTTTHWKTNYQNTNEEGIMKDGGKRAERPLWSYPRNAYTSSRGNFTSEYKEAMGTYGHNPLAHIDAGTTKLSNTVNEHSVGTTKVTNHIPGYSGFIPKADSNVKALDQARCDGTRDTIIKQNIVENYLMRVPGYAGYNPRSAINDRGTLRQNCLNTNGETFS